jgi:hypothetical protein
VRCRSSATTTSWFLGLIVGGIVAAPAIAQDQETLKIESLHDAADPLFPAYVSAARHQGHRRQQARRPHERRPDLPRDARRHRGAKRHISFETTSRKGEIGEKFAGARARGQAWRHGQHGGRRPGPNRIPRRIKRLQAAGVKVGAFRKPAEYTLEG